MDIFALTWWRCLDAYELFEPEGRVWRPGKAGARPASRTTTDSRRPGLAIRSKSKLFETYEPLKIHGDALFRNLAEVPATPAGMLSLTNGFGMLKTAGQFMAPMAGTPTRQSSGVDDLLTELVALRGAIGLFESGKHLELVERFNRSGWGHARHELIVGPDGKIVRVLVPINLIHAIWLQFAAHVESPAKLLRCQHCGKWFRVGTGTKRRESSKYCAPACKQAAFAARKEA